MSVTPLQRHQRDKEVGELPATVRTLTAWTMKWCSDSHTHGITTSGVPGHKAPTEKSAPRDPRVGARGLAPVLVASCTPNAVSRDACQTSASHTTRAQRTRPHAPLTCTLYPLQRPLRLAGRVDSTSVPDAPPPPPRTISCLQPPASLLRPASSNVLLLWIGLSLMRKKREYNCRTPVRLDLNKAPAHHWSIVACLDGLLSGALPVRKKLLRNIAKHEAC